MKNFVLLISFIFMAASVDAFSYETHTKKCEQKFETNSRSTKNISMIKVNKKKKSKVKSE